MRAREILEELFGSRVILAAVMSDGTVDQFPAVLSRNTIKNENPYRLTWFQKSSWLAEPPELIPKGHIDLRGEDYEIAVDTGELPWYAMDRLKWGHGAVKFKLFQQGQAIPRRM